MGSMGVRIDDVGFASECARQWRKRFRCSLQRKRARKKEESRRREVRLFSMVLSGMMRELGLPMVPSHHVGFLLREGLGVWTPN